MEAAKLILRNEDVRTRALTILLELPLEPIFEVVIKPYKRDRSAEQNARLWALHNAAAKHTGDDANLLHMICCEMFLGKRTVERGGKAWDIVNTTTNYYDPETMTTRKLNVSEMKDFMERVERNYIMMGVPTGVSSE